MTCSKCGHGAAWHSDEAGCLWLATGPGVRGCDCRMTQDAIRKEA